MADLERIVINKHYDSSNDITLDKFSDVILPYENDEVPYGKELLREGEIILCTNNETPGLYIYTTTIFDGYGNITKDGKIVRVTGPETIKLTNAYTMSKLDDPSFKLLSGMTLEDAISSLEGLIDINKKLIHFEMDRIEMAIGLDQDGNHIKTQGNYTSNANTIAEEITAIDTALKSVDDASIENITLNNVDADINNNHAYITIGGKNILLTDYYADSATTRGIVSSADTINFAIAKLDTEDKYIQSELNETQKGAGLNDDGTYPQSDKPYIIGAISLTNADNLLSDAIFDLQNQITRNKISSDFNTLIIDETSDGTNLEVNIDDDTLKSTNGLLSSDIVIKKIIDGLDVNVRESFALISGKGNELGDRINIYKDSSLVKVEKGYTSWTIDAITGEYINRGTDGNDALVFIYRLIDGMYSLVSIDISEYLKETEFKNGLKVEDGVVSIESDTPEYLVVKSNSIGVKVIGVAGSTSPNDGLATAFEVKEYADKLSETIVNDIIRISKWTINGYEISEWERNKPVILDGNDIKLSFEDLANPNRNDHDGHTYVQTSASGTGINILASDSVSTAISKISQNIDLIQAGGGLNEDGTYSKNVSANYISTALSLKDADNKLDSALKAEETARIEKDNALQNELNKTQVASGLDDNGNYVKNTSANYISNAVSLNNADTLLDTALKTEEATRINNDNTLQTNINTLRNDTISSATTLQNNIDTLRTDTVNSATTLQNNINALRTDTVNSATTLQNNINTEITNRTNADDNLQKQIDVINNTTIPNIVNNIDTLSASTVNLSAGTITAINNEITNRTNADNNLQTQITNLSNNLGNNYLPRSGGSMTNTNVVSNMNADLLDGLHLNGIDNKSPNSVVRTDGNGYLQTYYIYYGPHEKNESNPSYVCGFNSTDNYIRTYNTAKLNVERSVYSDTATNASNANKVSNALSFGSKSYNGSAAQTITASDLGALTSHQTIYDLTFNAGAFTAGTFDPNGAAKTINVPTKTSHLSNDSGYITTVAWNDITNKPSTFTPSTHNHDYLPLSGGTLNGGVTGTTFTASGGFFDTSDERLKDFKNDIIVDFEKLKQIPKKYFTWKNDELKTLQIGTSAQKVEEIYPELVKTSADGTKHVSYNKLSILALDAIDQLYEKNNELKNENKLLKERLDKLEKLVESLIK